MRVEAPVKPPYLGLLNAISIAERNAGRYLKAWADVTPDPELRRALSLVAARETTHGEVFRQRIERLGFSLRDKRRSRAGGAAARPRRPRAVRCREDPAPSPRRGRGGRRRRLLRLPGRQGGRRVRGRAHARHAPLVRARGARLPRPPPRRLRAGGRKRPICVVRRPRQPGASTLTEPTRHAGSADGPLPSLWQPVDVRGTAGRVLARRRHAACEASCCTLSCGWRRRG